MTPQEKIERATEARADGRRLRGLPTERDKSLASFDDGPLDGTRMAKVIAESNPGLNASVRQAEWRADLKRRIAASTDIERVRRAAAEVYRPEGVELWLNAPNKQLNNATPMQMIAAGDTHRVLNLLGRLAEGLFS